MADVVDRLAQSSGAGDSADPKADGYQGRDRTAEGRIQELVKERNHFKEEWQGAKDIMTQMQRELQEIKGSMVPPEPARDGGSSARWEDLSDEQLQNAYVQGAEEGSPAFQFAAMREMMRRTSSSAADQAKQASVSDIQDQNRRMAVLGEIQDKFGDAVADQNSDLFRAADVIAGRFRNQYGDDVLQRHPELIRLAFYEARENSVDSQLKELQELRQENERLRARASMEMGSRASATRTDEERAALQRGDVRGAAKAVASRLFGGR